jgi:hypothetical protein
LYTAWLNPYIALVSAVDEPLSTTNEFMVLSTPFDPVDSLLSARQWGNRAGPQFGGGFVEPAVVFDQRFGGIGFEEMPALPGNAQREPNRGALWVRSVIAASLIAGLVVWRAARHVAVPRRKTRIRIRRPVRKEPVDAAA